jgi:hypothetical protein
VAGQATYTPTSNLAITFKMGRNYLNDKGGNYDVDLSSPIWTISNPCSAPLPCTSQSQQAGQIGGPADNSGTTRDVTVRNTMSADATWVKNFFGQQHTIKGGWQRNAVSNDVFCRLGR